VLFGSFFLLLIEVHAKDQRRTQLARDLDEFDPRWMLAKDIADYQFALGKRRRA